MVGKPALPDVHEPVIAVWIGGKKEETWIDEITDGVIDDPLHHFTIKKLHTHPDSMDDGRAGMKVEFLMIRVSFKTVDIEDSLDVTGQYLLNDIRLKVANPEALR